MLYNSTGTLRYGSPRYLVLDVDPQITAYYRSLIPKSIRYGLNLPMYPAHISVVRNEEPVNLEKWKVHEGEVVPFQYCNIVENGEIYWWLDAYSRRLNDIRVELGLKSTSDITRPPDHRLCFHITLANSK